MKKLIIIISVLSVLTSCVANKQYKTPTVVGDKLFRTDNIPTDSLSVGVVSWKQIFTDNILQEYIQKALQNNIDIRIALQNINISQAYLNQSKAAFLPTLSAGANFTYGTSSLNSPIISSADRKTIKQSDIAANASWEIDIWSKISAQNKASYSLYLAQVASHQAVTSEIVNGVATAYYQLLMLDKQKQILQNTITLRQKSLETVSSMNESGVTNKLAVKQNEALLLNAQSQLVTISSSIRALENSISVLMGEQPQALKRNSLDNQTLNVDIKEGFPASLLQNRPDVNRAEKMVRNTFYLTNAANAAFYPTISITGRAGLSSVELDKLFDPRSMLANLVGGIAQPIFAKRQIKTQYEVAKANQEIALLNFKKVMLSAGREVSDAINNINNQDEFIKIKSQELSAYNDSSSYSTELFNSGMASYLEVITSEVNRLNAELSLSNAQFLKMQYQIALYKALGGGWR